MKRTVLIIALVLAGAAGAQAQNWATVTATNITDLNQQKLAAGQLCFLGTDQNDTPINFMVGGGGMVLKRQFCSGVTNGAVTAFTVPNPALTSPTGVYYRVTVIDSGTGQEVLRYGGVTFSGGTFNLDTYAPNPPGFTPAPLSGTSVSGNLGVTGNIAATGTIAGSNLPATISGTGSCSGKFVSVLNAAAAPTCSSAISGLTINGSANVGTTGTGGQIAGGLASPSVRRDYIGDGTGWRLEWAKRAASVDTLEAWLTDGGVFNAVTGYQINGTGTAGNYLRGNGSDFVSSPIVSGDVPWATPGAIGATTPSSANFTTLTATGLVKLGRVQASGAAPTCSVTGAGSGATCTMLAVATDSIGSMFITAGTSPGASGTITLTFSSALGTNGAFCFFQPGNGSGAWNARASIQPTSGLTASISANWDNNGASLVNTSTYTINFLCAGR
jgi:hypothetical protein